MNTNDTTNANASNDVSPIAADYLRIIRNALTGPDADKPWNRIYALDYLGYIGQRICRGDEPGWREIMAAYRTIPHGLPQADADHYESKAAIIDAITGRRQYLAGYAPALEAWRRRGLGRMWEALTAEDRVRLADEADDAGPWAPQTPEEYREERRAMGQDGWLP